MAIEIRVRAESRFKTSTQAYNDKVKHGYNPTYVHPKTYRIVLKCDQVPFETVSWEWRIIQRSTKRVFNKTGKVLFTSIIVKPSEGFNLPAEGNYDCQLIVKLRGGKKQSSAIKTINLIDNLIVVIGDSAASGQGNPDKKGIPEEFGDSVTGWDHLNPLAWADSAWDSTWDWFWETFPTAARAAKASIEMNPKPKWLEKKAYRSMRSGATVAARKQESARNGKLVTFLNFARSGSTIKNGLINARNGANESWIENKGQLFELKSAVGKREIDALIISVGVNDVGFTGSLERLITGDILSWGDTSNREREVRKLEEKIADLKNQYAELNKEIQRFNVKQVYITEYPTSLFDKIKNGQVVQAMGCEIFNGPDMSITPRDAKDLKRLADKLNKTIQTAAKKHSWTYVGGIANRFAGHGYCTGKNRLFVKAEESLVIQGDTEGTLHPNRQGHTIIAEELSKALKKGLKSNTISANPGGKVSRPTHPKRPKRPTQTQTTNTSTVIVRDHRD